MKKKNICLVCPITTKGFRKLKDLKPLEGPGYTISLREIAVGPVSIESEFDEMLAAPDTVAKIIAAEREGVDAVVIDCMGDPGLKPAREAVKIPVLGPGETSMHLAAILGHKFSVVTVLQRLRPVFEDLAHVYGLATKLALVRSVEIPVLDLESSFEATAKALTEQAKLAVENDQADVIIFGCTGMLGYAERVRQGLLKDGYDAPVIDPVPATIRMAAAVVEAKLAHSKVTYPPPPIKSVFGFDQPEISERKRM